MAALLAYLIGTNVLLRWASRHDPLHPIVRAALRILQVHGAALYVTPQTLIECGSVFTRPLDANGFGLSPAQAAAKLARLQRAFWLAPDTPAIYPEWQQLVTAGRVSGRQVYDARLVAVMRVHGLKHLLTVNGGDFTRYPGVVVVDPQTTGVSGNQ